jgi:hypothetical protein
MRNAYTTMTDTEQNMSIVGAAVAGGKTAIVMAVKYVPAIGGLFAGFSGLLSTGVSALIVMMGLLFAAIIESHRHT